MFPVARNLKSVQQRFAKDSVPIRPTKFTFDAIRILLALNSLFYLSPAGSAQTTFKGQITKEKVTAVLFKGFDPQTGCSHWQVRASDPKPIRQIAGSDGTVFTCVDWMKIYREDDQNKAVVIWLTKPELGCGYRACTAVAGISFLSEDNGVWLVDAHDPSFCYGQPFGAGPAADFVKIGAAKHAVFFRQVPVQEENYNPDRSWDFVVHERNGAVDPVFGLVWSSYDQGRQYWFEKGEVPGYLNIRIKETLISDGKEVHVTAIYEFHDNHYTPKHFIKE